MFLVFKKRYLKYHQKKVINPLTNELMPVIIDASVDPKFGTGVVKVTPGHSLPDYEIGVKHSLPFKDILDEQGRLKNVPQAYLVIKRLEK